MDEYTALIRELARDARNFQRDPLKRAEIAVILAHDGTISDEALGGHADMFIEALKDEAPYSMAGLVMLLLRKQCETSIEYDVSKARDDLDEEFRIDNEFAREISHV